MNGGPYRTLQEISERLGYARAAGTPLGIGVRNSGTSQVLVAQSFPNRVQRVELLKGVGLPQEVENMGCATVHVSVRDDKSRAPFVAGTPNQRIQLEVDWNTGRGPGEALIDATQGAMFTMNGAHVVNVFATFVSNQIDAATGLPVPLVGGNDKRIAASIQWGTATFQPAFMPVGSISLVMNVASIALPVPLQARRVVVFSDTPAAVVTISFQGAGGGRIYGASFTSTNPDGAAAPVVAGAEFFTLTSTVACNALAVFELWL